MVPHEQAGDDDCDDPAPTQHLGEQEGAEGERHGERDLDEMVVTLLEQPVGDASEHHADEQPDGDDHQERGDRPSQQFRSGGRATSYLGEHSDEDDVEHDDGGPVVEQRFPFEQHRQTLGGAEVAHQRQHADRISGGEHAAEQQPVEEAEIITPPQQPPTDETDDGGVEQYTWDGEQSDWTPVPTQLIDVHPGRPLEQQRREQYEQDEVGGHQSSTERQVADDQLAQPADDQAHEDQRDGVRKTDPAGSQSNQQSEDERAQQSLQPRGWDG